MKSVVVFCGSSLGNDPDFSEIAFHAGAALADAGVDVIYGGAKVGLMGAVANGALSKGGNVTGVLPRFMRSKEIAHENLTELILVDSMHERKLKMHELSDAIIALPGGFGTMEELFEMLTWAQLGLHKNPIGILNAKGFYNSLLALADKMFDEAFLKAEYRSMLIDDQDIEKLVLKMKNYVPASPIVFLTDETT